MEFSAKSLGGAGAESCSFQAQLCLAEIAAQSRNRAVTVSFLRQRKVKSDIRQFHVVVIDLHIKHAEQIAREKSRPRFLEKRKSCLLVVEVPPNTSGQKRRTEPAADTPVVLGARGCRFNQLARWAELDSSCWPIRGADKGPRNSRMAGKLPRTDLEKNQKMNLVDADLMLQVCLKKLGTDNGNNKFTCFSRHQCSQM